MSLAGAGCSTTIGLFAGGSPKYGCGEGDDMVVVVVTEKAKILGQINVYISLSDRYPFISNVNHHACWRVFSKTSEWYIDIYIIITPL